MSFKKIFEIIPIFPLSAFLFASIVILLWTINLIPSPTELVPEMMKLYETFGNLGLFFIVLLEGLAYIGLYFPGVSILFVSILFSSYNINYSLEISLIVALALTASSLLNYLAGKKFNFELKKSTEKDIERNLFFAILHPNLLSFYFFHRGLTGKGFWKIIYVPLLIFPYAFGGIYILAVFSDYFKERILGDPFFGLTLIAIWLILSILFNQKKYFTSGIKRIYKSVFS
ncbi:hypothetical protein HOD88_02065 [archaeon]|jgi:hypothetical protein|nr:hypothetical protein [archaeon]